MRLVGIFILCITAVMFTTISFAGIDYVEKASDAQQEVVQKALGDQYPISKAVTVKSFANSQSYYVGAEFHTVEAGDMVGVWLVNGKRSPKLVCSVDGNAFLFSRARKANEVNANATGSDPEVRLLKKYLQN